MDDYKTPTLFSTKKDNLATLIEATRIRNNNQTVNALLEYCNKLPKPVKVNWFKRKWSSFKYKLKAIVRIINE